MRWLITVLAVFALVTAAHAQSAGPPKYSVGDTWTRSNGLTITVVKVDENGTVMSGVLSACPTCISHLNKNLEILNVTEADGKPVDVTRHEGVFLGPDWRFYYFPLEVKKTWSMAPQGWIRGSPARFNIDCGVEAYEDIKTKAGTFKAYRITYNWARPVGNTIARWTSQLWYAPEVKQAVKFQSSGTGSWELVSYSLK